MPPTTRESQRAELHKAIWRVANDLRGSVDGWDFKSYVLGMLFYRFISENLTAYLNRQERAAGNEGFDYAQLEDEQAEFGRAETVKEKGFYILPSELFANVRANAPNDEDLNETLGRVFKDIEGSAVGTESEDDLKGLFQELDPNSNKLGNTVAQRNQRLVKLINAIGAGLLVPVTDTDTVIEDPNIVGANVELDVSGQIGATTDPISRSREAMSSARRRIAPSSD